MSKKTIYTLVWAGMALLAVAATVKISEYPAVTTPEDTDKFILASGSTNKNITYANLKTSVNTGQATSAQLASATNLSRQAATNEAKTYTDAKVATYQPLLAAPLTNGHTSPITINTDVEINGNFTVNSTNATTTVSNIVVNGTLTGAGVNTVSNATWEASKTYGDSTFVTATQHNADTNSIFQAATNAAKAYHDANAGTASNPLLDLTMEISRETFPGQNQNSTTTGQLGWNVYKKGSAYFSQATIEAGHPSLHGIFTGTTSGDGGLYILGSATNGLATVTSQYPALAAVAGWTNTWVFKFSATNDCIAWIGLCEPADFDFINTEPLNWFGLIVDSANSSIFRYTSRVDSSSAFANSATLNTSWHKFTMWSVSAGTAYFSLDGGNVQTITGLPDGNLSPFMCVQKTAGTASVTLVLDEWLGVVSGLSR